MASTQQPVMTNVYTGKTGSLSLVTETASADSDTTETIGAQEVADATPILTSYGIGTAVARIVNVEVYVDTGLEEFHQIGQRFAVSLNPGDIHIHGKIGRAYVNGALLYLLLGKGAGGAKSGKEPFPQPTFKMVLALNDPAVSANTAQLELDGVKLQNWMQVIPEDGFIMENVTFRALRITVNDNPAKPPFPGGA